MTSAARDRTSAVITAPPSSGMFERLDAISVESLRRLGGRKWSTYPDAIGAFIAEMDFGTAPGITQALRSNVERGNTGYLPLPAAETLRQVTAEWCATRYAWPVDPEQVRLIPDVLRGLEVVIRHFSPEGARVVVPTPAYMPFLTIPRDLGREIVELPMQRESGRWRIPLDRLDEVLAQAPALLLLCNPHNPLGTVLRRDEIAQIAEVVERHGARVFADEIHAPLVYDGGVHLPYAAHSEATARHTVTGLSASKAWNLPGLKCAQLVFTNPADNESWPDLGVTVTSNPATLGVVANAAAYSTGVQWLEQVLAYLDRNRLALADLVAEHLPDVDYHVPESTFFAWLDCRATGLGPDPSAFFLERAQVALVDGGKCGQVGVGHARLNFAMPLPILEEAVRRMGEAARRAAVA